jgi:hypothetical protein
MLVLIYECNLAISFGWLSQCLLRAKPHKKHYYKNSAVRRGLCYSGCKLIYHGFF